MAELRLVAARGEQRRPAVDAIAIGRRYRLAEGLAPEQARRICADPDLAIGAYRLTGERAEIMAAEPERLFVWDADVDPAALHGVLTAVDAQTGQPPALSPPVANRLTLTAARLAGPELQATGAGQRLVLTAAFELEWHGHAGAAQLAAVELVQSTRSMRFEDGSERCLLDTGAADGPVRYAQGDDDQPLRPVAGPQAKGENGRHHYPVELAQRIPEQLHGKAVAEVTVLEKYTSYFLHCDAPQDSANHIWVPLLMPVMWGWSIRVGRRTDGEWGILRRKLFMPTSQDVGLELPLWQTDSRRLARAQEGLV